MNEHPNLALIHAYNDAWIRNDIAAAARYIAQDIVFDGPIQHTRTAEEFIVGLANFARAVTGPMEVIAEFADDEQVLMLYDIPTGPFGVVRACDHFTIKNGKIQANNLLFDATEFRKAQAPQP